MTKLFCFNIYGCISLKLEATEGFNHISLGFRKNLLLILINHKIAFDFECFIVVIQCNDFVLTGNNSRA